MPDGVMALLVGSAVRASVLLILAIVASRMMARRSAALRHAILSAGIVGVIAIPAISAIGPGIRAPLLTSVISASLEWLRRPIRSLRREPVTTQAAGRSVGSSVTDEISLDAPRGTSPVSRGAVLVIVLWATGALVVGSRTLVRMVRARQLARRARPVRDGGLMAVANEIARKQRLAALPPILETPELAAPATVGIVRPAVLLPHARAWSESDARHVLAHELAHAARRDCLTQTLAHVACALHWFNPLVWIVERRMELERERACDDRALADGGAPERYATLLLDVARVTQSRVLPPAAVLAMAQPSQLETRLLAILDSSCVRGALSRRGRRVLAAVAATIVGLAGALELGASPVAPNALGPVFQAPTATQARHVEPDTRNDSVADPTSERVARASVSVARRRARTVLAGPDSALARVLLLGLDREPRSREDLVRERAAWALSQNRGVQLVEPLIASLSDKDWRVRAYAAWALGLAHDSRAVPSLIDQMSHPVWRLRAMAGHALAEIGDPRARAVMTKALTDEAWQVRVNGVRYLSRFGDADARARVRAAANDTHVAVRIAASSP